MTVPTVKSNLPFPENLHDRYPGGDGIYFRVAGVDRNQMEEVSIECPVDFADLLRDAIEAKTVPGTYEFWCLGERRDVFDELTESEASEFVEDYIEDKFPHLRYLADGHFGEGLYAYEGCVYAVSSLAELENYWLTRGGFNEGDAVYEIVGKFVEVAGAGDADIVDVQSYQQIAQIKEN